MNPNANYCLAQGVAIRNERFGGLVYRHDNRRLYFLHSHELVDFVRGLDGQRPLVEALTHFMKSRTLPESNRDTFLKALTQLEKLGVVQPSM